MQLIANDLSVHGQFHDLRNFRESLGRMQALRAVARRFGWDVECNRGLLNAEPFRGVFMSEAIGRLPRDEQRALMSWLTSAGPFWDDLRQHGPDDYLECGGEIVTDSGVGEAAFRSLFAVPCALVSFVPSDWDYSPVKVAFRRGRDVAVDRTVTLSNWRTVPEVEAGLAGSGVPMRTWDDVRDHCVMRFVRLSFAEYAFDELAGVPFGKSSAERIVVLLDIFDRRAGGFDPTGAPTAEAHRIDRDYFAGENALFTDSSPSEKREFRDRLTFAHPVDRAESIWCPWHGKERSLTLRLHFSWPIRHNEPVYVVHVGPKLTKR